jgi:hypothetical protein
MQLTLDNLEPTAKVVPAAGRPDGVCPDGIVKVPTAGITINRNSNLLAYVGSYLDIESVEEGFYHEDDEYEIESIAIVQAAQNLATAATLQLTVEAEVGADDPVLLRGTSVSWVSSHPSRVSVSASGLCTGVGLGAATITVTKDGQTDTVVITDVAP